MSEAPNQQLVTEDAELVHTPSKLSPKAAAAALGAAVAVVILNVVVALLTGELALETVLPTVGTGVAAVVAAYIKTEIIPQLVVPIPVDTVLVDRETGDPEPFTTYGVPQVKGTTVEVRARRRKLG